MDGSEAIDARHEIGANNPPGKLELERAADLTTKATEWVAGRPEITDGDMAKEANDIIAKLKDAKKALVASAKAERKPLDDAIAELAVKYKAPAADVDTAVAKLSGLAGQWLIRERDRIAAEKAAAEAEARRKREEAERVERERIEAQRRLDEERRRLAAEEEERKRAAAEDQTELERIAAENQAAADLERVEAERHEAARAAAAAEEANKAAKEAEHLASRKAPTAAIKSDTSRRAMTLRSYWSAAIENEEDALISYRDHPTVRKAALAAVLQAANEDARRLKDLNAAPLGVRFVHEERPV